MDVRIEEAIERVMKNFRLAQEKHSKRHVRTLKELDESVIDELLSRKGDEQDEILPRLEQGPQRPPGLTHQARTGEALPAEDSNLR
jgi:hypothetical protein